MIAIPDFSSGAMENWGLVTYRETCILVDPANSSQSSKQWVMMMRFVMIMMMIYHQTGLPIILSFHGLWFSMSLQWSKYLNHFYYEGGDCGVSRDCAPVVREPGHHGVVDTSLA